MKFPNISCTCKEIKFPKSYCCVVIHIEKDEDESYEKKEEPGSNSDASDES